MHRLHISTGNILAKLFGKRRQFVLGCLASQLYAMVSLPGNLLSLNVCMLMTSSVFTITGACGLCFNRRWHFRDILSSSTMALQKDLYRVTQKMKYYKTNKLQLSRNNSKIILNRLVNITALKVWNVSF